MWPNWMSDLWERYDLMGSKQMPLGSQLSRITKLAPNEGTAPQRLIQWNLLSSVVNLWIALGNEVQKI